MDASVICTLRVYFSSDFDAIFYKWIPKENPFLFTVSEIYSTEAANKGKKKHLAICIQKSSIGPVQYLTEGTPTITVHR